MLEEDVAVGEAPTRRAPASPAEAPRAPPPPQGSARPRQPRARPDRADRADAPRADAPRRRVSPDKLQGVLDAAQMLAGKGKKPEAFAKYKEVLESDPAHPEALAWAEDYLRSKREYGQLRDVLLASVRAAASDPGSLETRKERLREVAGLCEGKLRDVDGAITAWRQLLALDRGDESARRRSCASSRRRSAGTSSRTSSSRRRPSSRTSTRRCCLEKKLAKLQEEKRKDLVAAAEAWARIARLAPDDDRAILTASSLFEKGERSDLAAQRHRRRRAGHRGSVARGQLLQRLAELREQLGDGIGAGDAYAEAAERCATASSGRTRSGSTPPRSAGRTRRTLPISAPSSPAT